MPWLHSCSVPGKVRIFMKRARPGDTYACVCGKVYELGMRGLSDSGKIVWTWGIQEVETDTSSTSEVVKRNQTGFQANSA